MRAPSLARRCAMPRPMPRVPPVTSATRFLKDIPLLALPANQPDSIATSTASASPIAVLLIAPSSPQLRDDDSHVVGLLRRSGPFLGGLHQPVSNVARLFVLQAYRRGAQPVD